MLEYKAEAYGIDVERVDERGTKKAHIYDGWAWRDESSADAPDWMPAEITEANVAKQGIEHLEEI